MIWVQYEPYVFLHYYRQKHLREHEKVVRVIRVLLTEGVTTWKHWEYRGVERTLVGKKAAIDWMWN